MTIDQFVSLFPQCPFYLRYVERGPHKERKFIWHAKFTSDYFTSDSDRLVDDHTPPRGYTDAVGDTPEEALDDLAEQVFQNLKRSAEHAHEQKLEACKELADYGDKLERIKSR